MIRQCHDWRHLRRAYLNLARTLPPAEIRTLTGEYVGVTSGQVNVEACAASPGQSHLTYHNIERDLQLLWARVPQRYLRCGDITADSMLRLSAVALYVRPVWHSCNPLSVSTEP